MFTIKTFNPQKPSNIKYGFYVLNKGMNAGKPHYQPFRNSFVVICENFAEQNKLFWACHALHLNQRFKPYLYGTAVQTIRIDSVHQLLAEALYKVNARSAGLQNTIKHVNKLEEISRIAAQKQILIKQAQRTLLAEIFIKEARV